MRRLNAKVLKLRSWAEPRRFARKRGPTATARSDFVEDKGTQTTGMSTSFDLSSLRSGGLMSAPTTTSLDRIRSEISQMRREASIQREAEHRRSSKTEVKERNRSPKKETPDPSDILSEFRALNKPNDAYHKGDRIIEGLGSFDEVHNRSLFDDVDEVLRPANKQTTLQYMRLLFPSAKPNQANSQLLELLNRVDSTFKAEKKRLTERDKDAESATCQEAVSELAWLNSLNTLRDDDIRSMWKIGLVDESMVEGLCDHARRDVSHPTSQQEDIIDNSEDSPLFSLQERLESLQKIFYLQQVTTSIRDSTLAQKPSIDMAPTLEKVNRGEFEEISQRELSMLEKYEETPALPLTDESVLDSKAVPPVTPALLQRALCPSNSLLFTVAQHDPKIRKSLDVLERIKRESLLDPAFQEAVHWAHRVEEESVTGHVRAAPERSRRGRRDRERKVRYGIRGPMALPHHAADVPYFYNSVHSKVPPRGSFNLPTPALSKEEQAALRGRKRRMKGRTRFGK